MKREVFQSNKIVVIAIVIIISIIFTIVIPQADLPIWILPIVYVLSFFIALSSVKTKVVIEDGKLRYKKLFGGEEVELNMVSQIVTREVETIVNRRRNDMHESGNQSGGIRIGNVRMNNHAQHIDQERKVERIMYILDETGRTIFSFPANTIGFRNRGRFREAIKAVNKNIEVF